MKKLLTLIGVFAVTFLITACNNKTKRPKPLEVVYPDTIKEDKSKKVVHPYHYNMRHYHKASTKHFHH